MTAPRGATQGSRRPVQSPVLPRVRARVMPAQRSGHRVSSAHLQAAYPFVAEGGLGSRGVYVGRDLHGVDLAGVDRSLIDLSVEPRRLVIRGTRELPEPTGEEGSAQQLLAMEIDYGPFEREITFPVDVEIDKAHAEQRNGLLWISLPVRKQP